MSTSVLFICLLSSIVWVSSNPLLQNIPIQALLKNNCPHHHHQKQQQQQQNVQAQIHQQHHQHTPCQQNAIQQHTTTCQQHGVQQQQGLQQHTTQFQQPIQHNSQCQQQIMPNMKQILEAVLKNQIPMTNSHQQTQLITNNVPQGINHENNRCPIQNQNQEKPQVVNNYFVLPPELFLNRTKIFGEDVNHNLEINGDVCELQKEDDEIHIEQRLPNIGEDVNNNVEISDDFCELEKEKDEIVNIEERLPNMDANGVVDLLNGKNEHHQVNNKPNMPLVVPANLKKYYEMYEMIKNIREQKQAKGNSCHCNGNKYGPVNYANNVNYGVNPDVTNDIQSLYAQFLNPQKFNKRHDDYRSCHKNVANPEKFEQPWVGDPIDFVDESQLVNGNRKARTPNDEAIIKKVKSKYPKLPEAAVRTMLSDMKRQLMKQQKAGFWNPYNGMMKNFCPTMPMYMVNNNMKNSKNLPWYPKRHRQVPNNGKLSRNFKNKSKPNVTCKNSTKKNDNTLNQTAVEYNEKRDSVFYGNGADDSQLSKPKLFENTTPYAEARHDIMPELGTEKSLPNIDDNDIDDDANDPDFTITFDDEDYYYDDDNDTERAERDTPRNKATEPRLRRKEKTRKHGGNNARNNSRHHMKHENVHDIKHPETIKEEEKIVFKIPPGLETPDFQTVKVNKDDMEYYDDYYPVFYKISRLNANADDSETTNDFRKVDNQTYEKIIAQLFDKGDDEREKTIEQPKSDKIETLHANSKIADYSHRTDEGTLSELKGESKENTTKNGDTTLVIAKTVPDGP